MEFISINLMIADDHKIIIDGYKAMLFDVDQIRILGTATNGEEAVDNAIRWLPDVVLMDISMPLKTGIEATAIITKRAPSVKVIIVSMYSQEDYFVNAIKAGAKGYLLKQETNKDELVKAIEAVYHGGEYFCNSVSTSMVSNYIESAKKKILGGANPKVFQLTKREKEILKLFVGGQTNPEIAANLNISIRTVDTHKTNIMNKFNFKNTVEMVKYALRNNIVEL